MLLRGSRETRSHVRLYVCGQWKRGTAVCGTRGRLVDTLPISTVRPRALCWPAFGRARRTGARATALLFSRRGVVAAGMTWPAAVCAPLLERGSLVLEVRMSRTIHANAPRDFPHETRYSGIRGVDEGSLAQPAQVSQSEGEE